MKVTEVYTVEYSTVQKCYHIETLDRTIKNNLETINKDITPGYVIIGIFKNYEAASDFIQRHRQYIGQG